MHHLIIISGLFDDKKTTHGFLYLISSRLLDGCLHVTPCLWFGSQFYLFVQSFSWRINIKGKTKDME